MCNLNEHNKEIRFDLTTKSSHRPAGQGASNNSIYHKLKEDRIRDIARPVFETITSQ